MAYGLVMDVPAPVGLYDALHAEIGRRAPHGADGLLLHVGRETPVGFQIIEVWDSQQSYGRFIAEVFGPAMEQLSGGQPPPAEPAIQEFEPRGLIVPSASVAV